MQYYHQHTFEFILKDPFQLFFGHCIRDATYIQLVLNLGGRQTDLQNIDNQNPM